MTPAYLEIPADTKIPLTTERDGFPRSVHVIDQESIDAINAALAASRPLLVRGEPGTGKSQLARAAATALGRAFIAHAVDGRTETRDLQWTIDAVARLAQAQVLGAQSDVTEAKAREKMNILRFVHPGPLWWAFNWESAAAQAAVAQVSNPLVPPGWTHDDGVVVLIDEIDKADATVPNGLLDALGHRRFDVPGHSSAVRCGARSPLVVITTNEERALPDAFLRRCLVLHLALPEDRDELIARLMARGRAHYAKEDCADAVLRRAAELLADDRVKIRERDLAPPGLAEYIDLLEAVTQQKKDEKGQLALLERISRFALQKHPKDPGR